MSTAPPAPSQQPGIVADASPPPDDAVLPAPKDELMLRARHLLEAVTSND